MRLDNPVRGLARLLTDHADEPHATFIARILKAQPMATTHPLERLVRTRLMADVPGVGLPDVKMSVRRTLQALRMLLPLRDGIPQPGTVVGPIPPRSTAGATRRVRFNALLISPTWENACGKLPASRRRAVS